MPPTTFTQKLILTLFAAAVCAGFIHFYRHIVSAAFYETGEGWRESIRAPATPGRR